MAIDGGLVHIVDDDEAVRTSLALLLSTEQLQTRTYADASDFLINYTPNGIACLILDIQMPGMDGMKLQAELSERKLGLPIIFLTGHGDVSMAVKSLKAGAFDFLEKPFEPDVLIEKVHQALRQHKSICEEEARHLLKQQMIETLTPREHEIFEMLRSGKSSKVIAIDLNISERTVEVHRSRILHKMSVRSTGELLSRY